MYTGITGALKINGNTVAYISGWNVEDMSEIVETTKIGQAHKGAYVGHQSWSASADGAIVFEGDNSQAILFATKHRGDRIALILQLKDGVYFEGHCYIESLSVGLTAEGHGTVSISVKGCGVLGVYVGESNIKGDDLPTRPSGNIYWGINEPGESSTEWSE